MWGFQTRGYVPGDLVGKILGSGGFRVALVGFFVFCAIYGSRLPDPAAPVQSQANQVSLRLLNWSIIGSPDQSESVLFLHESSCY